MEEQKDQRWEPLAVEEDGVLVGTMELPSPLFAPLPELWQCDDELQLAGGAELR